MTILDKSMQVTEITSRARNFPDLADAWHHRQLAVLLARRNIKLRYKQTLLGSAWIVIQPILLSGILTLIVGILLAVPSNGLPYMLFAFCGTSLFSVFQRAVSDTGMSLSNSGAVILKVYFPRILIPISAAFTGMIDFVPVYAMLVILVLAYRLFPGWPILLSPVIVLITLALAAGIGLWVTLLDAVYRDMRLLVPSVLQLVFYISPVMYAESIVSPRWQLLYNLNPLVGLLRAFRWSMVAGATPPGPFDILWPVTLAVLLIMGGFAVFARLETFAVDRI